MSTKETTYTLTRCRSCGRGKARMIFRNPEYLPYSFWFVECEFCLASTQDGDTEQWAAEHWNEINGRKRALPPPPSETREVGS